MQGHETGRDASDGERGILVISHTARRQTLEITNQRFIQDFDFEGETPKFGVDVEGVGACPPEYF